MNPYQENIEIVKGFFRKPLVLIYAIFTVLPIFTLLFIRADALIDTAKAIEHQTHLLTEIEHSVNLSGTITSAYIIFIFEILIAVVMLFFFVKAGNEDDTLKFPITLFRVVSLVELIVTAFVSLAMILLIFLFSVYSLANFSAATSLSFIPLTFAAIPIILVYLLAQLTFSGSIKESINSIYLQKRGAKFYGVMNIILAVLCVYFAVMFAIHALPKTNAVIPVLVFLGVTAIKFMFGSIVGIKYASYIEGFANSSTSKNNSFEPIDEEKSAAICKKCGKPLTDDDYFCNYCGTPVDK